MSNLTFDTSLLYHIRHADDPAGPTNLISTSLYDDRTAGSVFIGRANDSNTGHQWQIYPVDSAFVLRSPHAGPTAYLCTYFSPTQPALGQTPPRMLNASRMSKDELSILWDFGLWGDGTFYMTNRANGTAWHLGTEKNESSPGNLVMDSAIEVPQEGQRFTYEIAGTVSDERFSTVYLTGDGSVLITTTETSDTSAAPSTTATTAVQSSGSPVPERGLSRTSQTGIGIGAGVAILMLLILAVCLLLKRRRQSRAENQANLCAKVELDTLSQRSSEPPKSVVYYEMESKNTAYELPGLGPAELPDSRHGKRGQQGVTH